MAFPSSTTNKSLASVFIETQNQAASIKQAAIDLRDKSAAGPISGKDIIDFSTRIADALDLFNTASANPGIVKYAKDQVNDQSINIKSEFTAMMNECVATRDWIMNSFPKNGIYLQILSFNAEGRYVYRKLTTAQTAGLRTQLDLLIATVS